MSRPCVWCLLGVLVASQPWGKLLPGDDSDGVPIGADTLPPHAVLRAGSNRFVHGTYIRDLAYLDPKRIVTFGKADAKVWYEPTGQLLVRIADGGEVADRFAGGPIALTLTRDLRRSRDVDFRTWNLLSGTSDKSFRHESLVFSASISEDGKLVAVAHTDWSIHLLDGEIGEVLASLPPLDSRIGHGGFPLVHLSGDGSVLVIVDLADPKNNVRRYRFRQVDEGPKIGKELSCVEFQGHCRLKAIEDHLVQSFLPQADFTSALSTAFSPRDGTLASSHADGKIRIWQVGKEEPIRIIGADPEVPFPVHRGPACIAFSPRGKILAAAGDDGTITLWNPDSGQQRMLLVGHDAAVTSLVWHAASGRLLSGSLDCTVFVWQLPPELAE